MLSFQGYGWWNIEVCKCKAILAVLGMLNVRKYQFERLLCYRNKYHQRYEWVCYRHPLNLPCFNLTGGPSLWLSFLPTRPIWRPSWPFRGWRFPSSPRMIWPIRPTSSTEPFMEGAPWLSSWYGRFLNLLIWFCKICLCVLSWFDFVYLCNESKLCFKPVCCELSEFCLYRASEFLCAHLHGWLCWVAVFGFMTMLQASEWTSVFVIVCFVWGCWCVSRWTIEFVSI